MVPDPLAGRRIAMWSGPRNISTALMRSWENRADTVVCDEPLYAHYLKETGLPHPGREKILAAMETDWRKVVATITGDIPGGAKYWYQKHMAHHLLPHIPLEWLVELTNVLLIRDPREMLTSLIRITPNPTVADTGLSRQVELFERLEKITGTAPMVLDARDVLSDPEELLGALCAGLDVPFDPAMLGWPAGPRDTDGVWARYWYGAVRASTGFQEYRPKPDRVPDRLLPVLEQCRELYDRLYRHRLIPG